MRSTAPLALLGTSLLGLGAGISAGPLNAYPQALFPTQSESAVVALHTVVGVGLAVTPVLLVPLAGTAHRAVLVFALGGLGCSAVFPLTVGLAGRRFPADRARVSSVLFAALVAGQGVGSLSVGLLHARLDLGTIYPLAALPPALALLLALRAARELTRGGAGSPAGA
jgi:predicted MFS family arabinose efflux permease